MLCLVLLTPMCAQLSMSVSCAMCVFVYMFVRVRATMLAKSTSDSTCVHIVAFWFVFGFHWDCVAGEVDLIVIMFIFDCC
eukprot:m.355199 g.355199  ORF g.355199 m.355199 type:complete len:80 (+) comp17195_c0_seq1:102-341(+)